MSIRSLTDFMEVSLRSARRLASTATVTGRRGPQVDASVRGADFWWPKLRTFGGHQCGPLMAISADFFVAMDIAPQHAICTHDLHYQISRARRVLRERHLHHRRLLSWQLAPTERRPALRRPAGHKKTINPAIARSRHVRRLPTEATTPS